MNKLLEKYEARENKKPIIPLKDYYKYSFIISLIVIPLSIGISILQNIKWAYIVLMLILCTILSIHSHISFKYKKENSDEMVQNINNKINNIIHSILIIIFVTLVILSAFKEPTITLTLNFPTLVFIYYTLTFIKSGLFLLLDYNPNDDYEE